MTQSTIKRAGYERAGRTWYYWKCNICGECHEYLNCDAMLDASLKHRNQHRDSNDEPVSTTTARPEGT